jgi:hypothetical protein
MFKLPSYTNTTKSGTIVTSPFCLICQVCSPLSPGLDSVVPQHILSRTLRLCHLPDATTIEDIRELMEPYGYIVVSFWLIF